MNKRKIGVTMEKTGKTGKPNPGVHSRADSYFKTYKTFAEFCKSQGWKIYVKLEELMKECMEKE